MGSSFPKCTKHFNRKSLEITHRRGQIAGRFHSHDADDDDDDADDDDDRNSDKSRYRGFGQAPRAI